MYRTKYLITTDKAVPSYEKRLSICLRSNGFSFSVTTQDMLLTVGEAEQVGTASLSEMSQWVKRYFAEVNEECFGLRESELIIDTDAFTWVPEELYTEGRERRYLEVVTHVPASSMVYADHNAALKAYAVFSTGSVAAGAFKIAIAGIKVRCQQSKMVNAELIEESRRQALMLMYVGDGVVDIVAFEGGKMLLSRRCPCANAEEALYYGLDAMKGLKIESPLLELHLCGNVDRELYGLMRGYFPSVLLYNGKPLDIENPEFQRLHTYRYALILN